MPIPKSLANHKAYQDGYRARLLRLGPPYLMAASVIEPFLRRIVAQGKFYLRMHRWALPLVLDSKRIKSQVETLEGSTMGGPETRRQVTAELFGADVGRMQPEEFPKYGYLSCADPRIELFAGDEMSYQYGNVLVTLKKERMLHRTTMTVGASLCFGVSEHIVPTRVDNIAATCIPGLGVKPAGRDDARRLGLYMLFAQAVGSGRVNEGNFYRIGQILGGEAPTFDYFELQYHGEVSLEDIERVDVYSEGDDEYLAEMGARCAAAGIPFEVRTL